MKRPFRGGVSWLNRLGFRHGVTFLKLGWRKRLLITGKSRNFPQAFYDLLAGADSHGLTIERGGTGVIDTLPKRFGSHDLHGSICGGFQFCRKRRASHRGGREAEGKTSGDDRTDHWEETFHLADLAGADVFI